MTQSQNPSPTKNPSPNKPTPPPSNSTAPLTPAQTIDLIKSLKSPSERQKLIIQSLPKTTKLIAVSKYQNIEKITQLLNSGQTKFGENYLQEAETKWSEIPDSLKQNLDFHFIGTLQTNKAKKIVNLFNTIEGICSQKALLEIENESQKQNKKVKKYLQINIGNEDSKSGLSLEEAETILSTHSKIIDGITCIPPADKDPSFYFLLLKQFADSFSIPNISMGMSSDFLIAASLGATEVRIGSLLFGNRESPK